MSPRAKREYLEALHRRYNNATRAQKSRILDEYCATCGQHRKHAIRQLRGFKRFTKPKAKKRGRKSLYDCDAIRKPLKKIWLTANLPCSKRLQPILSLWLPGYEASFGALRPEIKAALLRISAATIDRLLKPTRSAMAHRGRSTTKPGALLRTQIPLGTNQWDQTCPGFLEADTVAHCGSSMAGQFVNSLDCVDIATGWTEQRAVWGRGEQGILEELQDIEQHLPFAILGFDCDNGGEFLNHHLHRHFTERPQPVLFTRSRAYRKDDNAHIEQKNWTHIRQWLGYERFDDPCLVPLLNELYRSEWRLFHNFFCPSVKLLGKERIGSKTRKRYDRPKTPYQRVMESTHIARKTKIRLTAQFRSLNPFVLREAIEIKLKKIFKACYKGALSSQRSAAPLR
jgi:hypothetical protein